MLISSQESIARMLGFDRTLSICAKILLEKHKESWDFLSSDHTSNATTQILREKKLIPTHIVAKTLNSVERKNIAMFFFLPESLHRWIPLAKSQTLLPHRSSLLWRSRRKEQNAITIFKEAGLSHFQTHFIQGIQNDSINCGIYSLTYLECWLNEMPFPTKDKGILVRGKPVDQVAEIDLKKERYKFSTYIHEAVHENEGGQICSLCLFYDDIHRSIQKSKKRKHIENAFWNLLSVGLAI